MSQTRQIAEQDEELDKRFIEDERLNQYTEALEDQSDDQQA